MAASRKEGLAKLSASRAGEKRTQQYTKELATKDDRIYDEVDEGVYRKIVKKRLLQDDFVEDDDNMGYADNGEEDWGVDEEMQEEDSEEERRLARKKAKAAKEGRTSKTGASSKTKVKPDPIPETTSFEAYRKPVPAEREDDFMNSIMSALDSSAIPSAPRPTRKRKSSITLEHEKKPPRAFTRYRDSDLPPSDDFTFVRDSSSPVKKPKLGEHASDAETPSSGVDEIQDEYDSAYDDVDFENLQFDEPPQLPPMKEEEDVKPTILKAAEPKAKESNGKPTLNGAKAAPVKKLELDTPAWLDVHSNVVNGQKGEQDTLGGPTAAHNRAAINVANILEADGSLRFFWLDYLELDGKVYLVGKTIDRGSSGKGKTWVSCCVVIKGIERNLYVRPRRFKLDDDQDETDVIPNEDDVYDEFDAWRTKCKITKYEGKFVQRRYVFDDSENGEDTAMNYLKVKYPFDEPSIPSEACSPSIEKIYGTNTSAFEMLVVKRKIMGPCWLNLTDPAQSNKGVSWCKVEFECANPKLLSPFAESDASAPRDTPPLTVMSIALRTIVNHVSNQREVVSASARFWEDMDIDDPKPPEDLPSSVHNVVRCLDRFPTGFEDKARNEKPLIYTMKNEKAMLSSLLAVIKNKDPDVIVGHDFLGVSLDILLLRLKHLKVEPWSCLGRFKRSKWPNIGRQGSNIKFIQGRLLCDLTSDAAKSMIASTTWSLSEMCSNQLTYSRQDIDPEDTADYFDSTVNSPDRLMSFVHHCQLDTYLQMALSVKVQILPLTKQLTALAGNSWNKTLNGGRAERNEYILLHEFHRLKYICPDKTWGKKTSAAAIKAEEDGDAPTTTTTKSKRDKYKGGLVFEPKRGLWDRYILVMDFNSLYPSIIQEYNIDFTTVRKEDPNEEEEQIPDIPAPDVPQGVLPRLIATLVNRRRQVKGLMKDSKATPVQIMQWDIKQKALKLTANSMYGCLGFEYSRFYARPLAALTTFKGREILTHTRELAESLQLDVVYGDTDSLFVNSMADNLPDALKMANMFKKQVNDQYKLLEIDLDAVFKRLLLLQKKKYAALKVEDKEKTSTEIKGLDMKRREFCALSKNVSKQVLEYILSGHPTEVVVEEIHEYLRTVGEEVREGRVSLEDLTIFKRLGKNPEDYDPKGQPHVQVALRMKTRGGSAKAGDVIPYIFCLGEDGQSSKTAQADKARHPDEVRRGGDDVKIDYDFYLTQQILPPVERLCDPIEGTDRSRIAECLGLDPSRFQTITIGDPQERNFGSLASLIPDSERFKDSDHFNLKCVSCDKDFEFLAVGSTKMPNLSTSGVLCPTCAQPVSFAKVQAQLHNDIRRHIAQYYEGRAQCTEETCKSSVRGLPVDRRCPKPDCTGTLSLAYTNLQMYNQLLYYASLFDGQKAMDNAKGPASEESIIATVRLHHSFFTNMALVVERYMTRCGQRWVNMKSVFSFMIPT